MSGVNNIFHLCAHSEVLLRWSFNNFAERVGSCTIGNKEVSSANNSTSEFKFSIYDMINYSTSICTFESGKCGKEGQKLQQVE